MDEKRTNKQNSALHLWFRQVAQALNKEGHTLTTVLGAMKKGVELPMTEELVKEVMWRPVQKALYAKHSTTELLKREEIEMIYDPINKFLSEKFGISVDFPHEDKKEI